MIFWYSVPASLNLPALRNLSCAFDEPHLQFQGDQRQDASVTNGGVYGAWCGSDQKA
jgi:hypothetical protein